MKWLQRHIKYILPVQKEMDELPNRPSKFCSPTYLLDSLIYLFIFLHLIYLARAGALLYQVEKGKVNGRGGDWIFYFEVTINLVL